MADGSNDVPSMGQAAAPIPMASSGVGHGRERSVFERLQAATDELQKLEKTLLSGNCAPRVLTEFRGAVDSLRQTAWAVQQWTELQFRIAIPTPYWDSYPKSA
jgi:hypothetical protein